MIFVGHALAQPDEYRGILHALYRIVTEEGFLELYRGLAPSIIGVIPYAGVNYFAYDSLRSMYKRLSKEERIGNIQTLLIGSLAGAIASSSTFPLEVARKQMQVRIISNDFHLSVKAILMVLRCNSLVCLIIPTFYSCCLQLEENGYLVATVEHH